MEQDPKTPRRLFTFDSVKPSRRSTSESAVTGESSSSSRKHGRDHSRARAPTLNQVSEENERWVSNDLTASPKSTTPEPSLDTRKQPRPPKSPKPRPLPPLLTDITISQPDNLAPLPSPSAVRWNTIRQHVRKKHSGQSQTSSSSHSASTSTSTLNALNAQAQSHGRTTPTPKPSRLAQRLGFRNVVEQIQRETTSGTSTTTHSGYVYVNPAEEARKIFATELQRACVAARYVEHGTGQSNHLYSNFKGETNKTNNINTHRAQNTHNHTLSGSTLSLPLPFMSSTSLAQDSSSQAQGHTTNVHSHNRQQSQSENTGPRVMGSLKPLYQVLLQHSQRVSATSLPSAHLPVENLVLSTLLVPFLRPGRGKEDEPALKDEEQEQWFAIEAFDVIVKTWNPPGELPALERILWVIKAAACPPVIASYNPYHHVNQVNSSSRPLQTRLRLLNLLWSLLVPTETFYPATSPQILISLFHALFSLQALLVGEVEAESKAQNMSGNYNGYNYAETKALLGRKERDDARVLRDLIEQVRRGSSGDLEDMKVEEEYNALFIEKDEREGDRIREAIELEGLARALEFGFGGSGRDDVGGKRWMLEWGVEEYWPPPAPGEEMTPLRTAIHARILGNFTRACVGFILSTSSPSQNRYQSQSLRRVKDATLVIRVLQTRVLPELEIIERDSSGDGGKGGVEGIEEAKRSIVKIALEVAVVGWASSGGEDDLFSEGMVKSTGGQAKEAETLQRWASEILCGWYRAGVKGRWKACFEKVFADLVSVHPWSQLLLILHALLYILPDDVRKPAVVSLLPLLNTRIVDDPPPLGLSFEVTMNQGSGTPSPSSPLPSPNSKQGSAYFASSPRSPASPERSSSYFPPMPPHTISSHPLTSLLTRISQLYPAIFYKPLFLCAAASKEYAVMNHLCTVVSTAKWMRSFWTGSGSSQSGGAEMVCVAIMSDVPGTQGDSSSRHRWTPARLGQSALILELIAMIQRARRAKEGSSASSPPLQAFVGSGGEDLDIGSVTKFAAELEGRLAILVEAKEKTRMISPTQRLLFSILFREIRLLTRSLKGASWLPRFVRWFTEYHELGTWSGSGGKQDTEDEDLQLIFDEEIVDSVTKLRELYSTAREGTRGHNLHRSTILFSGRDDTANPDKGISNSHSISDIFAERTKILDALGRGFQARILKLLVAMSILIPVDSHRTLGKLLWERYLDLRDLDNESDIKALSSICFLFMQCAEKTPDDTLKVIKTDLHSSIDRTRLAAIRKLTTLINWRFQVMSQHVISDRARRPFKIARGPLPFVATDMGSNHFVLEIDPNDVHDKLPVELRKKLAEIGWDNNDSPVNQHLEWIRTPMSLLPGVQIDKLHSHNVTAITNDMPSPNPSPSPSPSRGSPLNEKVEEIALLRRNSSSGGPLAWLKRRAIWVPSLSQVFPRVASLAFDQNFEVSCAARSMIMDLMRNDPAILTRPIWDLLTGDRTDLSVAITSLHAFLHIRKSIPPAMAHTIFNSLAGFLKFASKQLEGEETMQKFARVTPILATVVSQVSEMSIREFRRAKIDMFFIPSGSLWFPPSAPTGAMFPRSRSNIESPFEDIPDRLVSITMLRIAQNMLFLSMLKRNPAEVHAVRKNMVRLILPSLDAGHEAVPIELKDLAPCRTPPEPPNVKVAKIRSLSILLSRSHLLLVAQIFRSISRHLNDRNELAVLVDGVNRILLAHGNDIGIVSHALIALMVASTRFRRLFASGGGYTLFMPAVFKVYIESEAHAGIRSAIEYAVSRFFAYHQETFIFQSLDSVSHVLFLPNIDGEWIAKNAFSLFASLKKGASPAHTDAAGIYDANKSQEREALMLMTADEKPQTFLASLSRDGPGQNGKARVVVDLPVEYESKRLAMDDLVRMFLTVIAHDVTISRAQQFLKFLRFLVPCLYEASQSTRNVLTDGVDALGIILSRGQNKGKPSDSTASRVEEEPDMQSLLYSFSEKQSLDKSKSPSDPWAMRYEYLYLVISFTQAGGKISAETSRTVFDLVKAILGASGDPDGYIGLILADFTRASLIPKGGRSLKGVKNYLRDFVSLYNNFPVLVDWTGVIEVVRELTRNPNYNNDSTFSQLVVNQICGAGLAVCHSANDGLTRLPYRIALISLMTETVFLPGADIFAELEKRPPQNDFLAWVVLPFALSMKTMTEIEREKVNVGPSYRASQARAWLRLLSYAMSCCQKSQEPVDHSRITGSTRSKNTDEKNQTHMSSLLMALQVIKVIVIRAEKDLTTCLPGIWSRLGVFLRDTLMDGGAEFGLRAHEQTPSASPLPSPRASGQFDLSMPSIPQAPSTFSSRSYLRPRVVDYCLWSILGLLCAYRSPLYLQMHAFMHEKVRMLDEELRYQERNLSLASPRSRRPSSSVFTKPRMSFLSTASPEASPRLTPISMPSSPDPFRTSFQNPTLSSLMHVPDTLSSDGPGLNHRIVHLGLVSNQNRRSASPSGTSMRSMAKSTKLKSMVLIRKTFLRVRTVQQTMGYSSRLLPMPSLSIDRMIPMNHMEEDAPAARKIWTRWKALQEILNETRELMAEFDESLQDLDDDMVIVDADQSAVL
ncbi:hypothetical protein K435DRAFT_12048 [Dendrothele bispora CBS 962.96]|uniref:Protein UNC80 C-terminal domain-containing protein n=1 Tax=Dendrothele bispora (strain CBS 962.96) TaxID=1314807 RepID=A0A4S8MZ57_DENBC|nr:hypothetical protein K435DRAFT_12048 [Dendrothele bispora CBS 962.96]